MKNIIQYPFSNNRKLALESKKSIEDDLLLKLFVVKTVGSASMQFISYNTKCNTLPLRCYYVFTTSFLSTQGTLAYETPIQIRQQRLAKRILDNERGSDTSGEAA